MAKLSEVIPKYPEMFAFCEKAYMDEWKKIEATLPSNASKSKSEAIRREAQRTAIDRAFVTSLIQYPDAEEELIWDLISDAHKLNLAHLDDFGIDRVKRLMIYDRCISADQSWRKSSGHSFERYISSINTPEMEQNEVQFLLKSEVFNLIKQNKIANVVEDLDLIREWAENFDLYAVQTNHGDTHIFGCIQVKTSIRDRVGRDDQFSGKAMDAHFWVVEAVLNGDFFSLPKYEAMVNGGSVTYPVNNWHGVYVMAGIESNKRIYRTDTGFTTMAKHAVIAAKTFGLNRAQLVREWIAE